MQLRADFDAIANWVTPSSSLLDLGCGDGSFLEFIRIKRHVKTYGVEIMDANAHRAHSQNPAYCYTRST